MDEEWARWRSCARRYFRSRLDDPNLVDELVQEACVRVWLSQRHGRVRHVAVSWVLGISWRLLADHFRTLHQRSLPCKRESGRWRLDDVASRSRERHVSIDGRSWPLFRVLRALDDCIRELPEVWRPLVEGRSTGLRLDELSRLHGLSVNAVKLRLFRGRRRLREAVLDRLREEEEVDVQIPAR